MSRLSKKRNLYDLYYIFEEPFNPGSFKEQFKEMFSWRYLTFLFKPGVKDEEMDRRESELNKYKSKRSFLRRLRPVPTLFAIILLFIVTTWAVFAEWIVFAEWTPAAYGF